MKTFQEYLTIKQAARILGVAPITLRRWDNTGRLESRRHPINRYRLYDRKALTRLLEKINA
ncbi:MAG: MerR family transcriptional regulator [Elusimicrobia bacterium RIFCSPLOWO2_12_FULL_59_9]|nr:MAG: MerR family transcriptional regulator [Elusimicrobia bacterium RIFCSPLOWO2_12_FULL_59_9]